MSSVEKLNSSEIPNHPHILCTLVAFFGELGADVKGSAHATKVPGLIFLSGQTPNGPDGKVVEGGIQEHTVGALGLTHSAV